MSKYNADTVVVFHYSIGFSGECRKEKFTLGELDYDPEWDGDSKEALDEFLEAAHENWSQQFVDYGWHIE
ncbi:hypothetical protein BEYONPHE_38 [Bacillus phage Beyonphe]|nr:hypothetical protein BEYONPHE_38 [Bacillus phage Beyonphe]